MFDIEPIYVAPTEPNQQTIIFCYKHKAPSELILLFLNKSGRRDSNPLPTAWEAVALPGELLPLIVLKLSTFIEE